MIKRKKKGIALILGFIIIVVLLVLGGAILGRSINEARLSRRYLESTQAFWIAEGGISAVRLYLNQTHWYLVPIGTSSGDIGLGEGVYNYTIYDTDGSGSALPSTQLRIVSDGTVGDTTRSVEVVVNWVPDETYKYAVSGKDLVELKSGTTVHGDIYVDGDAEVKAGSSVVRIDDSISPADPNAYDANVYYTGSLLGVAGVVEGSTIPTTDIYAVPTYDWTSFKDNANFVLPAASTLNGTLPDGIYYVTGNIQLNNVKLNNGAIIAEGKIEITGNTELRDPVPGFPVLANQTGTMELDGTAEVEGLVYCDGTGVELKTGATMNVYGSVMATRSDVEIKAILGSLDIYFKPEHLAGFPTGHIEIDSWRERDPSEI